MDRWTDGERETEKERRPKEIETRGGDSRRGQRGGETEIERESKGEENTERWRERERETDRKRKT